MITAGIDLGSHVIHVGIVRNENNEVISACHLTIDKEHHPEDVHDIYDRLVSFMRLNWVDRVVVERPLVFVGQGFPILKMSELYTISKLAAYDLGADFVEVTPAQWRKQVLGKGNASKSVALHHCSSIGWKTDDHNIAEAICVAMF